MAIEFDMAAHLLTRTNLTDIVSTKIYGDKAPQGTQPPFIVYMQTGGERFYHTQGSSDLNQAAIVLRCRAKTYAKAHELFEILRDELDGFSGTWNGAVIDSAFLSTPQNISEAPNQGDDTGYPGVQGTLTVMHLLPVPTFGD